MLLRHMILAGVPLGQAGGVNCAVFGAGTKDDFQGKYANQSHPLPRKFLQQLLTKGISSEFVRFWGDHLMLLLLYASDVDSILNTM